MSKKKFIQQENKKKEKESQIVLRGLETKEKKEIPLKLIHDVVTRWNSCF